MRLTLRVKLMLIVCTVTLAFLAVVGGSALISVQQSRGLADVEGRLVPRLRLGPKIQTEFQRLRQQMRDAVAAQDATALEATLRVREQLLELITEAAPALEAADVVELRAAIRDYSDLAYSISRRMISGETGEKLVKDIEDMQARDRQAVSALERTTALGEPELKAGLAAVQTAANSADRFRLVIGIGGLFVVVLLSTWVTGGLLRSLQQLSHGFTRFATGQFGDKIPVLREDELGDVAKEANQMAESLEKLSQQRDRTDWVKATQVGLSEQLREDLVPAELARRALWFLARRVEAGRGALYLSDGVGRLRVASQYAGEAEPDDASDGFDAPHRAQALAPGEGLVGQAALSDELLVVTDVPVGYAVRSGVGAAPPRTLVLLPLTHLKRRVGVLELALFGPCSDDLRELLGSVREGIALALSVADSRAAQNELLAKTREQADRLVAQEEELRARNQVLLTQQEELARVSSYKSQFLANMSHELRTPLNSMLLLSGLLAENSTSNLTAKQVEHAKTVHAAGKDLLAMINQILDLAKIEAGKQDLELDSFPLTELVTQMRGVFAPLAAEKRLSFVVEIASGLPETITTDRYRLQRILANLVGNAIKFTDKGEVALRIGRPASDARFVRRELSGAQCYSFVVSDTGVGIPPAAQERVFSPFEQVDSKTNRRYVGTGLGLAIARESATLLGGELQLDSTLGVGSTFTCYLPERAPLERRSNGVRDTRDQRISDDRHSLGMGEPYLLIIEDDLVLAEQLVDITRARSFKVVVAATGEEGLRLARSHLPRGILLDVGLPDVDGWTVMERLKHDPLTRSVPVHFTSAMDAKERGLAMGAVGYLVKPAVHSEWAALIQSMTSSSSVRGTRVLLVEDDQEEGSALLAFLKKQNVEAVLVNGAGQAMDALSGGAFGCLVLDLGLPDMDGLGFLEGLSVRPEAERPRVIVHTGRTLTSEENRRLRKYAETVISKNSTSHERLLDEVRAFLNRVTASAPAAKSIPPPAASSTSLQGFRILLAEDDMRTAYAVSALLRGWGAEVLVVENGKEALETLQRDASIHLVLTDIMMPEMDGYEAMRRIRKEPRFAKLPILALTASTLPGERERCLSAGASEYLTKPVDGDRLLAALEDWLLPQGSLSSRTG